VYTLDTNAIIYYLAGDAQAQPVLEEFFDLGAPLYVSAVTVIELFSHTSLGAPEKDIIERLLDSLFIIPVDMELARAAGELRSQYRLKTPDSLIAATALGTRTTLVTRNMADFLRVSTLKLLRI
jgi:predicted nucleic acid-binding protein